MAVQHQDNATPATLSSGHLRFRDSSSTPYEPFRHCVSKLTQGPSLFVYWHHCLHDSHNCSAVRGPSHGGREVFTGFVDSIRLHLQGLGKRCRARRKRTGVAVGRKESSVALCSLVSGDFSNTDERKPSRVQRFRAVARSAGMGSAPQAGMVSPHVRRGPVSYLLACLAEVSPRDKS